MKKIFLRISAVVLTMMMTFIPVFAEDESFITVINDDGSYITYYNDGSTLTVSNVIYDYQDDSDPAAISSKKTVSGKVETKYTDSNGKVDWIYILHGTFSYIPGVSSECTDASYEQEIYYNGWKFSEGSATKSGNSAFGNGKYELYYLFIIGKTYNVDLHMSCDVNGKISK